jgi:hypothetical protein
MEFYVFEIVALANPHYQASSGHHHSLAPIFYKLLDAISRYFAQRPG